MTGKKEQVKIDKTVETQAKPVKSKEIETFKGRREGIARYKTNPSIAEAVANTKTGVRRVADKSGQRFMVVSEHGEVMAPAGFHEVVEVDKTQFIKFYVAGIRAFGNLTKSGATVFEIFATLMQDQIGKDLFYVSPTMAQDYGINSRTYRRGMRELLEHQFVFESALGDNWYYVNVNFVYNGNRLAFIKEIRLRRDPHTPDMFESAETPALTGQ